GAVAAGDHVLRPVVGRQVTLEGLDLGTIDEHAMLEHGMHGGVHLRFDPLVLRGQIDHLDGLHACSVVRAAKIGPAMARRAQALAFHPVNFAPMCSPIRSLSLALLFLAGAGSYAQGDIRDTTIALTAVTASYSYQIPGGDMALRFGPNSNIGINAFRKNKRNYFFGAEGSFLFGSDIRESGLLRNVVNSQGQIVDNSGIMADVLVYERGWTAMGIVGKIMPVVGPNPNSGI